MALGTDVSDLHPEARRRGAGRPQRGRLPAVNALAACQTPAVREAGSGGGHMPTPGRIQSYPFTAELASCMTHLYMGRALPFPLESETWAPIQGCVLHPAF